MQIITGHIGHETDIARLFQDVFSASEGVDEGALIGDLSRAMMMTPQDDLYVFSARKGGLLLGCIFLSRMVFAQDDRQVFILSPVAVRTDWQKTGVGQRLIRSGLQRLRDDGVDYVLTYGDPNYYGKTGFQPIPEIFARAPFDLSQPHGWLGRALSDRGTAPLRGASRCVEALNRAELW